MANSNKPQVFLMMKYFWWCNLCGREGKARKAILQGLDTLNKLKTLTDLGISGKQGVQLKSMVPIFCVVRSGHVKPNPGYL